MTNIAPKQAHNLVEGDKLYSEKYPPHVTVKSNRIDLESLFCTIEVEENDYTYTVPVGKWIRRVA